MGNEQNWTTSRESSTAAESAHSNYQSQSAEFTESFSAGSIRTGLKIRNDGPVTFTLTNMGISVLQWNRGDEPGVELGGDFKTMGTLLPQIDSFTLAPGQSTPVLEASADGVDAAVIKSFLSNPGSLVFQPSSFDLQDANGIDFDFITETTFSRTGLVEIDFGGGDVAVYRIATNVSRSPGGGFRGIDMKTVMQDILELPYTVEEVFLQDVEPAQGTGRFVLASVDGRSYVTPPSQDVLPTAFWTVVSSDLDPGTTNFEDIRLSAGDYLRLVYTRDNDSDGVFEVEEEFFGSSDSAQDSDGDGVGDYVEVKTGWLAGVAPTGGSDLSAFGYPKRVFADPRSVDTDGDGFPDAAERDAGTDPTHPDTDRDGLSDGQDPHPLTRAGRLFVDQNPNSAWANVNDYPGDQLWTELDGALDLAVAVNTNLSPHDDVAEIWVARGVHTPTFGSGRERSFRLPNGVAVYGGFVGGETKRGQRDRNPLSNQTVLSGEVGSPAASDNLYHVVDISLTDSSAVLDGFTITRGYANDPNDGKGGGLRTATPVTVRNLLFYDNYAELSGGGMWSVGGDPALYVVEDCTFLLNKTSDLDGTTGAGLTLLRGGTVRDCVLSQNGPVHQGGGIHSGNALFQSDQGLDARVVIERCTIANNSARLVAGGIFAQGGRIDSCDIVSNDGGSAGAGVAYFGSDVSSSLTIANSRLWNNTAPNGFVGGGVYAGSFSQGFPELRVINCSIVSNVGGGLLASNFAATEPATLTVQNCVLWDNTSTSGTLEDQQVRAGNGGILNIGFSAIEGLSSLVGSGLIGGDPRFVSLSSGNLRLDTNSPCVDSGTIFVDLDPTLPGFQPLPPFDLDGSPRVFNGNGVGEANVDLGAYEKQ